MSAIPVVLSLREANVLRRRLRNVITLRRDFLDGKNSNTIHDLRVSSRRLREILDYLQFTIQPAWQQKLKKLTRTITKTLGRARESEVNLSFIRKYAALALVDPAVTEVLIHAETKDWRQRAGKAKKEIRKKSFEKYEVFLSRFRGSRNIPLSSSNLVAARVNDFLAFPWQSQMNDDLLHDLRIRTKKLRYAVEIYDALHSRNLGRFVRRMKLFQDLLGDIHDLSVFASDVNEIKEEWTSSDLTVIPSALDKIRRHATAQKIALYAKVYPAYAGIIKSAPPELPLLQPISVPAVQAG